MTASTIPSIGIDFGGTSIKLGVVKGTEVIDSNNVEQLSHVGHTINPECELILLHKVPVIDRIAPSLSCR